MAVTSIPLPSAVMRATMTGSETQYTFMVRKLDQVPNRVELAGQRWRVEQQRCWWTRRARCMWPARRKP
jgi:hypothetical protein